VKVLLYAINSIGIGHLSRLIAIARAMQRLDTSLKFLFLTELSDNRLLEDYSFPYVYIPPLKKVLFDPEYVIFGTEKMLIRNAIIQGTIEAYKPQLVIHDSLIDDMSFKVAKKIKAKQVFVTRQRNNLDDFMAEMIEYLKFMELIVLAEPAQLSIDLPEVYEVSVPLIRRTISEIDVTSIRRKYRISCTEPLITICNGGGTAFRGFEDSFWEVIFRALRKFNSENRRIIGITGPLSRSTLIIPKNIKNMQIFDYEPNLVDLFSVSDLVIARGGYNTANELEMLKVPALTIPASRKSDNQYRRLKEISKRDPYLRLGELGDPNLFRKIESLLKKKPVDCRPKKEKAKYFESKNRLADKLIKLIN